MSATEKRSGGPLRRRRIARLKREIDLLEHMDGRLWRRALLESVVAVALIATLTVLTLIKLQFFDYHPAAFVTASIAIAALAWWLGRYTLWIPAILLALLLVILFEGNDLGGLDWGGGDKRPAKQDRQAKIDAALAKRRKALIRLKERA